MNGKLRKNEYKYGKNGESPAKAEKHIPVLFLFIW